MWTGRVKRKADRTVDKRKGRAVLRGDLHKLHYGAELSIPTRRRPRWCARRPCPPSTASARSAVSTWSLSIARQPIFRVSSSRASRCWRACGARPSGVSYLRRARRRDPLADAEPSLRPARRRRHLEPYFQRVRDPPGPTRDLGHELEPRRRDRGGSGLSTQSRNQLQLREHSMCPETRGVGGAVGHDCICPACDVR